MSHFRLAAFVVVAFSRLLSAAPKLLVILVCVLLTSCEKYANVEDLGPVVEVPQANWDALPKMGGQLEELLGKSIEEEHRDDNRVLYARTSTWEAYGLSVSKNTSGEIYAIRIEKRWNRPVKGIKLGDRVSGANLLLVDETKSDNRTTGIQYDLQPYDVELMGRSRTSIARWSARSSIIHKRGESHLLWMNPKDRFITSLSWEDPQRTPQVIWRAK